MEALGAAASILQLVTLAASIIQTIHRIHDQAKEGLARASQRTAGLKSLLATLRLIESSQPSEPDGVEKLLSTIRQHLFDLDKLLSKLCTRTKFRVFSHFWTAPGIIKTENKIIEGLDNLERAKNTLILHLCSTQGRSLLEVLERIKEQETRTMNELESPVILRVKFLTPRIGDWITGRKDTR
ncbi:hypothetical protein F5Y16DRAFT_414899 [Xylariaceae sp. FL0255]|nr:hypothetical protein F5Y16DRAFT_414899 [Xylariaceae sp. FL0255]